MKTLQIFHINIYLYISIFPNTNVIQIRIGLATAGPHISLIHFHS